MSGRCIALVALVCAAMGMSRAHADGDTADVFLAHPESTREWWVMTGHLERETGGGWVAYQIAFHRVDVDTAATPDDAHRWAFRSIYPASLALTDLTTGRFLSAASVDRDGAGTARASEERPELQYRSWRAAYEGGVWRIDAASDSLGIGLTLVPERAPMAIGADGVLTRDHVGPMAWRDAISRLATTGTVRVGTETFRASGVSWLDHVHGRAVCRGGEAGWDFLNIHLRDGADLALYRFRALPGRDERRTGGVYVSASGIVMRLETLTTRFYPVGANRWNSPVTSRSYPMRWRVEVPALSIRLDVTCAPRNQELATYATHGAAIWRGSVEAQGSRGDQRVTGAGFMELAGYAGRFPPEVAEAAEIP